MPESKDPTTAHPTIQPKGILTMEYQFWVYVVGSNSGTLYIGMTNDLARRMREHKSGEFEGFAAKYGCDRLVYCEKFDNVLTAIGREKQLKGWRRSKKVARIESVNPRWQDLSEHWGCVPYSVEKRFGVALAPAIGVLDGSFPRYGLIICSRPSLFTTLTDAVFPLARS